MRPLTWVFHVDSVPMTADVVAGKTSLGGSESACLGLARALVRRGHQVFIAATKLANDVPDVDAQGVRWIASEDLKTSQALIDPDVFVALRQPHIFRLGIQARWRMLWNQDMLTGGPDGEIKKFMMAMGWAYDEVAYVSEYHRKQWEGVAPELTPIGWVTKNGFDASLVPTDVAKVPGRIIHISRPERAMTPLLAMWPELKRRVPHAELHICRYASMYDGEGSNVKAMVEQFDRDIARVNEEVGGIVQLGQLAKPELYRAIASAEVMWYPGVVDFAETSCIAAIEAQACGTPFVGSYKGALPETVPYGKLISGDAMSPGYQADSLDAVGYFLKVGAETAIRRGREHVQSYTYDAIAAEWEAHLWEKFEVRSQDRANIVRALLHEDDYVAVQALTDDPALLEECGRVIRGEAQTAEHYGKYALDPEAEMGARKQPRHLAVIDAFTGCRSVLDLACGNGAFAILMAEADPQRRVVGIDYSGANIEVGAKAAERHGVADRVSLRHETVCDLATGQVQPLSVQGESFDGVFLGEFCEHVAGVQTLLSGVRDLVGDGARVVITVPSGPFGEMRPLDMPAQKGHVHHFRPRDLDAVFGQQQDYTVDYLPCGHGPRGSAMGHWVIRFVTSAAPFGARPLAHWHTTMRPWLGLSVGILCHNCTPTLPATLNSIWPIADEIILADCSSDDRAELDRIAVRYGATVYDLPPVSSLREGFSAARNATLELASNHWFLWIDSDEVLAWNAGLAKYLQSGVFNGYALMQNHLMLDAPKHADTPVRVFRKRDDVQFYGVVHEQPQQGHCNGDILPTLQLFDVQIAHTGYLHENIRRAKSRSRNRPLLVRDSEVFPDRELGKVLWIREFVTEAAWRIEDLGGTPDAAVFECYRRAVALFEANFLDPAHRLHDIARPFYEQAVKHIAGAMEFQTAFGGAMGGMKGRQAAPKSYWVRTPEHIKPLLDQAQAKALKVFEVPPLDVEPWVPVREGVAA